MKSSMKFAVYLALAIASAALLAACNGASVEEGSIAPAEEVFAGAAVGADDPSLEPEVPAPAATTPTESPAEKSADARPEPKIPASAIAKPAESPTETPADVGADVEPAITIDSGTSGEANAAPTQIAQGSESGSSNAVADTAIVLLGQLEIKAEHTAGYDRDNWPHWRDENGDGCHARCEVLASEQRADGTWYSVFDGEATDNPSRFDVDHLVPLAEAHESGGWAWDRAMRQRYANDLSYDHSLIAVSASSNRSKGKKDPAEWLPPAESAHCFYAESWVVIKARWGLAVDEREHRTLMQVLVNCPAGRTGVKVEKVVAAPTAIPKVDAASEQSRPDSRLAINYCDAGAELVEISGPALFDLGGWSLSDDGEKFIFAFISGTLIPADGTLLVASGQAQGDIHSWGRPVWNNSGDIATLTGPGGSPTISLACG